MNAINPPDSGTDATLIEELAADMVRQWRAGHRPPAESFLARFPELGASPAAVLELLAEELTLREEFDAPVTADELAARFPRWAAQVRALASCHDALVPHVAPHYPVVGETLGGYRLESELGRGAHGRVFRAFQPALGRRVVVKLVPLAGREHVSLARLQHTHIVPLYSVEEFPVYGLRALCMPDFGGRTLSDVAALPPEEVCRIGACLADALGYAHARGLLHLDVKPSNVLIADDGTPMLLDFHLARPPVAAGTVPAAGLGGTPGFMAPEHAAAMDAVRAGVRVPTALDCRTDVFALGVVLSGLFAGRRMSAGLSDLLVRATSPDPDTRYPSADALAADLRRHLADDPLRGVRNRSIVERWRKWRRRRPLSLPLLLVLAFVGCVGAGFAVRAAHATDRAAEAARVGVGHLGRARFAEAAEAFRTGEVLVSGVPLTAEVRSRLRAGRRAAERGLVAEELHTLAEHVRPWYSAEHVSPAAVGELTAACEAVWSRREMIAAALADTHPDERWRRDLLDIAVILAHLGPKSAAAFPLSSVQILDEAEALLGSSTTLELERAAHLDRLGQPPELGRTVAPPRSAWDHVAVGRSAVRDGAFDRAGAAFERALALAPADFWANYYAGVCRLRGGRPAEALAAFSACVALAPDGAWCHFNRGLAFAALDRPELALADFDRAAMLDSGLGSVYLARSDLHHAAGRHADALLDLRRATDGGLPGAVVDYRRALVQVSARDRAGAIDSLRSCLGADPAHPEAAALLEKLGGRR